jgi:hypothetical protein
MPVSRARRHLRSHLLPKVTITVAASPATSAETWGR